MIRIIVPIGVLLVVIYLSDIPRAAEAVQLPAPIPVTAPQNQYLGVASCAAMACHHANGTPGSVGSEYSTWIAVDPHAKAYQALFNRESRRIHENLARYDESVANYKGAHQNPLCLQCHGLGTDVAENLQGDGASCERCHGPARNWKSTHYLHEFDRQTPGFKDLRRDLKVRVEVCMDCHVGSGDAQVDHDLIAAGHPRLRFEYSAYYASYPRHWGAEHVQRGPIIEDEQLSWLIGELTSAKSALELLASRAANAQGEWPEFAESSCSSCHQRLKADGKPSRGNLPWASWYYDVLPTIATVRPMAAQPQRQLLSKLEQLRLEMGLRIPDRQRVTDQAKASAELLAIWRDEAAKRSLSEAETTKLIHLLARSKSVAANGWDGGTQLYLSLAALIPASRQQKSLLAPLKQLRDDLLSSYPSGSRPLYDSPSEYSQEKVQRALDRILKTLE